MNTNELGGITNDLLAKADELVIGSRVHLANLREGLTKSDEALARYTKRLHGPRTADWTPHRNFSW